LSQALEGSKFEDRPAILESLVAKDTPALVKLVGRLRKYLDTAKLSTALKSKLHARIKSVQKKGIAAKKWLLTRRVDLCLNGGRD
jgi:hypothetical protein